MHLESFRVQNYKKIKDTGWVGCRDLTVFVGKNEAGKSAIFRGLSKLNPSDGEKYDGLKEFPRRRYTDEFAKGDWPVASAVFTLSEEERNSLIEICPVLKDAKKVEVTRHYSWKLTVGFEPRPKLVTPDAHKLRNAVDIAIKGIQGLTAPEG